MPEPLYDRRIEAAIALAGNPIAALKFLVAISTEAIRLPGTPPEPARNEDDFFDEEIIATMRMTIRGDDIIRRALRYHRHQQMSRRDDYKRYLNSSQWAEQRNFALARTEGFCQFCGNFAANVHHVKYPKRFGDEHPHNLVPVCERCHALSHGIQKMKTLTDVTQMKEVSPTGTVFKYLIAGARVYASAESWVEALQVPRSMKGWFEAGLPRTALLKKDMTGGNLEMEYLNIPVYRWHCVADLLRSFDHEFAKHQFKQRGRNEQYEIAKFHENYERLVAWGYDLQERALSSALNARTDPTANVSQETLIEALRQAVAPRLSDHDNRLHEHDVVISEIKGAVPAMRPQEEFISVRQAINELGYDPTVMPLPGSRENLSGLAGRMLSERRAERGHPEVAGRLEHI